MLGREKNFCSSDTFQGPKLCQTKEGTSQQWRQHGRDLCSVHSDKTNKMFSYIWKGMMNNPGNIIMPLYKSVVQPQMGEKGNDVKKEEVFNQYFCSTFGKKQDEMLVSRGG